MAGSCGRGGRRGRRSISQISRERPDPRGPITSTERPCRIARSVCSIGVVGPIQGSSLAVATASLRRIARASVPLGGRADGDGDISISTRRAT